MPAPLSVASCGLLIALAASVVASSCGYQRVRYDRGPEGAGRVAVETFVNQTNEPGVELVVSEAMRREFLRNDALTLVSDPAEADLVVRGQVLVVHTRAESLSTVILALEYELTLVLDVAIETRTGDRIEIDPSVLTASDLYLASADLEAGRKNRQEVIHRISQLLAERLHDSLGGDVLRQGGEGA